MHSGGGFEPLPLLARSLPADRALRLDLERTFEPAESPWGVFAYLFAILADERRVGRLSLRIGETPTVLLYAGHLGFTVDEPHRRQGYARRAARLILPLARAHRLDPLWITCNPANAASIRVIESLGACYVETVAIPPDYDSYARGERQKRRYRLDLGSGR
jgi:predicted acetyltransferase